MICEAEELIQRFKESKIISPKEVMKAELLATIGCPKFNGFVRILNKYLIDEERKRMAREFPTTSEGDER